MPDVSVILPTKDRPGLLQRALASVLAQQEVNFEVLLVDNNSAHAPLEPAAFSDPRVQLVREPAAGASRARNLGLARATGTWVTYLDDDDAYLPGKLARQYATALEGDWPLVLCGAVYHLRGRERRLQCAGRVLAGDSLLLEARWNTPLLFHRRLEGLRFDETLGSGEDEEFAYRVLARTGCWQVPVCGEAGVAVFPQPGPRVNRNAEPLLRTARQVLWLARGRFSRGARRRYLLRQSLGKAKLEGDLLACLRLSRLLLSESRGRDWRACANALVTVSGLFPQRWVS